MRTYFTLLSKHRWILLMGVIVFYILLNESVAGVHYFPVILFAIIQFRYAQKENSIKKLLGAIFMNSTILNFVFMMCLLLLKTAIEILNDDIGFENFLYSVPLAGLVASFFVKGIFLGQLASTAISLVIKKAYKSKEETNDSHKKE